MTGSGILFKISPNDMEFLHFLVIFLFFKRNTLVYFKLVWFARPVNAYRNHAVLNLTLQ